jgi:hypothetical protein
VLAAAEQADLGGTIGEHFRFVAVAATGPRRPLPGVNQRRAASHRVLAIGPTVHHAGDCFDRGDVAERTNATTTFRWFGSRAEQNSTGRAT